MVDKIFTVDSILNHQTCGRWHIGLVPGYSKYHLAFLNAYNKNLCTNQIFGSAFNSAFANVIFYIIFI